MEKENNIGEQIKQYRAKHHLTLTQFGQYFDPVAATNTIRNWENSKRKPNQKHQEQLKKILHPSFKKHHPVKGDAIVDTYAIVTDGSTTPMLFVDFYQGRRYYGRLIDQQVNNQNFKTKLGNTETRVYDLQDNLVKTISIKPFKVTRDERKALLKSNPARNTAKVTVNDQIYVLVKPAINTKIWQYRDQHQISQADFGKLLNPAVSPSQIWRWEHGYTINDYDAEQQIKKLISTLSNDRPEPDLFVVSGSHIRPRTFIDYFHARQDYQGLINMYREYHVDESYHVTKIYNQTNNLICTFDFTTEPASNYPDHPLIIH